MTIQDKPAFEMLGVSFQMTIYQYISNLVFQSIHLELFQQA